MQDQIDPYAATTTGTTIVAIQYDQGVLFASDTQATSYGIWKTARFEDKFQYVHDNIFATCTGNLAQGQIVTKYARHNLAQHAQEIERTPYVKTAVKQYQSMMYKYKNGLNINLILGGWDPYEGLSLYQMPQGGSVFKTKMAYSGQGSVYLQGYLQKNFRENMSYQEAKKLALTAVFTAIKLDANSGGAVRLLNIKGNGQENQREYISFSEMENY